MDPGLRRGERPNGPPPLARAPGFTGTVAADLLPGINVPIAKVRASSRGTGILVAEDMFDELFCVFADFEARQLLVREVRLPPYRVTAELENSHRAGG